MIQMDPRQNLHYGYLSTKKDIETNTPISNVAAYTTIATEIDYQLFLYNQVMTNFYMANFYRGYQGDNAVLDVNQSRNINIDHLQAYSMAWKINARMNELHKEFYKHLTDDTVVRVYNGEPIILTTPSRRGYVIIHPTVQELVTGTDENGDYYEANLGGNTEGYAVINGHSISVPYHRRNNRYVV